MAAKSEIIKLLREIAVNYPSAKTRQDVAASLWYRMFHAVPIEILIMATTKHMTESEFFPSIASVFKFIDIAYNANAAWDAAYDFALAKKEHNNPGIGLSSVPTQVVINEPQDDLVKETLLHVTWESIAYSSEKNLPFVRKEFIEKYNETANRYNVARRGRIIRGDAAALEVQPNLPQTSLESVRSRVKEIMAQGTASELNSPENATEGVSEEMNVYSEEVDVNILNGSKIVSANEIL